MLDAEVITYMAYMCLPQLHATLNSGMLVSLLAFGWIGVPVVEPLVCM